MTGFRETTQLALIDHLPVVPAAAFASLEEQAKAAEAWETDPWAARAILKVEQLSGSVVWDTCCGTGILGRALRKAGYRHILETDLYDWGTGLAGVDFLGPQANDVVDAYLFRRTFSVFMNPPFSKAAQFVDRAFELGAREVISFQRFAWYESDDRREWFDTRPPARVQLCGNRAKVWLFTIPPAERTGSGMPTAHAWFVFTPNYTGDPILKRIWKDMR
jgi:predicted RNA methylase